MRNILLKIGPAASLMCLVIACSDDPGFTGPPSGYAGEEAAPAGANQPPQSTTQTTAQSSNSTSSNDAPESTSTASSTSTTPSTPTTTPSTPAPSTDAGSSSTADSSTSAGTCAAPACAADGNGLCGCKAHDSSGNLILMGCQGGECTCTDTQGDDLADFADACADTTAAATDFINNCGCQ